MENHLFQKKKFCLIFVKTRVLRHLSYDPLLLTSLSSVWEKLYSEQEGKTVGIFYTFGILIAETWIQTDQVKGPRAPFPHSAFIVSGSLL